MYIILGLTKSVFWSIFRVNNRKKPEPEGRVRVKSGRTLKFRVFLGQKTRKKLKIRVNPGHKNSGFFTTLVHTLSII